MHYKQKIVWIVLTLATSSCMVGPDYLRPPVVISKEFKEAQGKKVIVRAHQTWKIVEPRDQINRGEWWKIFSDKDLNELEDKLNHCNPSLAEAAANYRQAKALVSQARSALFPSLAGTLNFNRQTIGNGTTAFTSSSVQSGITTGTATTGGILRNTITVTNYAYFLNANWEPDIWGQVRRNIESAEASAQASAALWAATRLSLQGSVAQYYFELRTADLDQKLLDDTVKDYKVALQLTKNQYKSGVAARADIVQAQSQLELAEAQAINNGVARSQYEHALAVLIGVPPALFSMPIKLKMARAPAIPVSVPSEWLERRPDVAEAERLIKKANAMVGVAISAYYPTLNLSGTLTAASTNLGDLIGAPVIGWAMGSVLTEEIYDGGFREATVRAMKAAYQAQVAAYRQAVLTAFQNVEDSLSSLRIIEKQSVMQNKAAKSAKLALKLVTNQYKAGTVPYSSVITAEISAFNAEKSAIDVLGLEMISAVALVQALGGGWNAELLHACNFGVKS